MKGEDREFTGAKAGNLTAYLGMRPAEFFNRLVELEACPRDVSMSEAVWNLLLKPLYEKSETFPAGNGKLAEILYEAATALHTAQRNGAEFEIMRAAVGNMSASRAILEVFVDEKETPVMEIGIAGERELARHPERLEQTDTPPAYFMLHDIGTGI